jgi:hypothetical protein
MIQAVIRSSISACSLTPRPFFLPHVPACASNLPDFQRRVKAAERQSPAIIDPSGGRAMAASTPSGMRDRIFISYRRDDARGASGRVWDWLRIGFGRERVFRDVASIGAGKWRVKIDQALAASTTCVAVIGRRWADDTNLPRLKDPTDMVRYELETALASGERQELTVVPLLVEEATLKEISTAELPDSLKPLLGEWNVLELSESGWDDDTRRLIEAIAAATGLQVLPEPPTVRKDVTPLIRKPGGLMEQSNASFQRGDQG